MTTGISLPAPTQRYEQPDKGGRGWLAWSSFWGGRNSMCSFGLLQVEEWYVIY